MTKPTRMRAFAFTLMEVLISVAILAIAISAALGTMSTQNTMRRTLDESNLSELVLRQMANRLQTCNISLLGHVYLTAEATPQPQPWTLHLRATDSSTAATPKVVRVQASNAALTKDGIPPFRPLTQQDLLDAGILSERLALDSLQMYVEYYNLNTITGQESIAGGIADVEDGLLQRYCALQDLPANASANPRALWHQLVGDPTGATPLSPTNTTAEQLIMPATFSTTNAINPGASTQEVGAFNHGLVIRILISWRPVGTPPEGTFRRWRETVIARMN